MSVYWISYVINKYSIFVRRKCSRYRTLSVYYSQKGGREPIYYLKVQRKFCFVDIFLSVSFNGSEYLSYKILKS